MTRDHSLGNISASMCLLIFYLVEGRQHLGHFPVKDDNEQRKALTVWERTEGAGGGREATKSTTG